MRPDFPPPNYNRYYAVYNILLWARDVSGLKMNRILIKFLVLNALGSLNLTRHLSKYFMVLFDFLPLAKRKKKFSCPTLHILYYFLCPFPLINAQTHTQSKHNKI